MHAKRLLWASLGCLFVWSIARAQAPPMSPGGLPPAPPQSADAAAAPGDATASVGEVYNRGPLHEAFAAPTTADPVERPVIPRQPPEPIDEIPPEETPEGANIVWIPGYWAYDETIDDFLWISGLWRDAPPGRTWVPGYWHELQGGYQWISGAWAPVEQEALTYLPQPPPSPEIGPSSPPPAEQGYFWIPGNWDYVNTAYQWRPGYWAPHHPEWVWVPATYVWTPLGCVFIPGYWDFVLAYRGLCYAPVYFPTPPPAPFVPSVVINSWDYLTLHLFVQPAFGRYCFGDYYGPAFVDRGVLPFYQYHYGRGYDPLFVYYQQQFGPQFQTRLTSWHRYFVTHADLRPRATFREQVRFLQANRGNDVVVATNISERMDQIAPDQTPMQFRRLPEQLRERARSAASQAREIARERRRFEIAAAQAPTPGAAPVQPQPGQPAPEPFPRRFRLPGKLEPTIKTEGPARVPERPDQRREVGRPGETRRPVPELTEPAPPGGRDGVRPPAETTPRRPGAVQPPTREPRPGTPSPGVPGQTPVQPSPRPVQPSPRPVPPSVQPGQPGAQPAEPIRPRPGARPPAEPRPAPPDATDRSVPRAPTTPRGVNRPPATDRAPGPPAGNVERPAPRAGQPQQGLPPRGGRRFGEVPQSPADGDPRAPSQSLPPGATGPTPHPGIAPGVNPSVPFGRAKPPAANPTPRTERPKPRPPANTEPPRATPNRPPQPPPSANSPTAPETPKERERKEKDRDDE